MRDGAVTWRFELPLSWGGRLDPAWLPNGDPESWRQVFATEDRAGRVFAAGGAGMKWAPLAGTVGMLAGVLTYYREQLRAADDVAAACPVAPAQHVAAMAVPDDLQPPRVSGVDGPWRVCVLDGGTRAVVETFDSMHLADSVHLAEGAVAAERTLRPERVCWAEPVASRLAPAAASAPGWRPRADTALRLRAFAAEEAVAALCAAAATGQTGPDVVDAGMLCTLGVAVHRMILEYRTVFRAVWTDLEACERGEQHDADATALLAERPDPAEGRWRHVVLDGGSVRTVAEHPDRATAVASVAAHRAVDDESARWAEPVGAGRAQG
jgi:hypothetical protein